MNYSKEREEFIATMSQAGLPISVIRTVLARANTLQRNAELSCSSEAADRDRVMCPGDPMRRFGKGECICDQYPCDCDAVRLNAPYHSDLCASRKHESVPRIDVQSHRISKELKRILEPKGYHVDSNGDPRGCVLKLIKTNCQCSIAEELKEDAHTYYVPAKGLPASFWERNR